MDAGLVKVELLGFPHSVGIVLELVLRRSMARPGWRYLVQVAGHPTVGTVSLIAANANVSTVSPGLAGALATLTVAAVTQLEQSPYTIATDQLFSGLLEALDVIVSRALAGPADRTPSADSAHPEDRRPAGNAGPVVGRFSASAAFRPRVLLVDQSRAIRAQLSAAMADMEVAVVAQADQQGAQTALAEQHFDALIFDADLVSGSPTGFCRQFRQLLPKGLPVLILTSHRSAIDRLWQSLAGCSRSLSKPIDLERFRIELQRLLPTFPHLAETDSQLAAVSRMVADSRR